MKTLILAVLVFGSGAAQAAESANGEWKTTVIQISHRRTEQGMEIQFQKVVLPEPQQVTIQPADVKIDQPKPEAK